MRSPGGTNFEFIGDAVLRHFSPAKATRFDRPHPNLLQLNLALDLMRETNHAERGQLRRKYRHRHGTAVLQVWRAPCRGEPVRGNT